jgi:hypothetical protein
LNVQDKLKQVYLRLAQVKSWLKRSVLISASSRNLLAHKNIEYGKRGKTLFKNKDWLHDLEINFIVIFI